MELLRTNRYYVTKHMSCRTTNAGSIWGQPNSYRLSRALFVEVKQMEHAVQPLQMAPRLSPDERDSSFLQNLVQTTRLHTITAQMTAVFVVTLTRALFLREVRNISSTTKMACQYFSLLFSSIISTSTASGWKILF